MAQEQRSTEEKEAVETVRSMKIAIITGANQGIGRSVAKRIAALKDKDGHLYSVVIVCRSKQKGIKTRNDLRKQTGNNSIHLITCDVSSPVDTQNIFVPQLIKLLSSLQTKDKLCGVVLINNAAECPVKRSVNRHGVERQFATNVLGYHLMMTAVFGFLIGSFGSFSFIAAFEMV